MDTGGMVLPAVPASVRRARRVLRALVTADEDCALLVSELVTNAILHGGDPGGLVRVEWRRRAGGPLRVDVHGPGRPERIHARTPDDDEPGGRGLLLVDALADSWDAGPSRYGGTRVSFTLCAAVKPRGSTGAAPRSAGRVPRPRRPRPVPTPTA